MGGGIKTYDKGILWVLKGNREINKGDDNIFHGGMRFTLGKRGFG